MVTSPWAVMRMVGMLASVACTWASSARPSMPGRRTSVMTMMGAPGWMWGSASSAVRQGCTVRPSSSSVCVRLTRTGRSSSTNTTL
jgi:hypothetical protein